MTYNGYAFTWFLVLCRAGKSVYWLMTQLIYVLPQPRRYQLREWLTPFMNGDPLLNPIHEWGVLRGWGTPFMNSDPNREEVYSWHLNHEVLVIPV
jgi:hypothetical protein